MVKASKDDYFTQDELLAIYEKAGEPNETALLEAAAALYPDRIAADKPPMLKCEEGIHGRWFYLDEERTVYEPPEFTIKSGHCSWIAVMKNGTALKY